jgi:transaldolase
MKKSFFIRLSEQTPTEFWINNPTREHADLALLHGATGVTNNPSYTQKMIDHPIEGQYASKLLDESMKESDEENEIIAIFQRKLVKPVAEKFMPLFTRSAGQKGFVSIQSDPINEHDPDVVIREGLENSKLSPNICVKIPTTKPGLIAMEYLIAKNIPVNATEFFGIKQGVEICEIYKRASKKSGFAPMLYLSHIAGIYDDHLKNVIETEKIEISTDILFQAGLAITRKFYQIHVERKYPGIIVGGGARGLHHFTELVGGKICGTINWEGTADKLIESDPPVMYRLFNPVEPYVIDELNAKLIDFKRGWFEDGLTVDEFEEFGPVRLFASSFIKSWKQVLELIKSKQ